MFSNEKITHLVDGINNHINANCSSDMLSDVEQKLYLWVPDEVWDFTDLGPDINDALSNKSFFQ